MIFKIISKFLGVNFCWLTRFTHSALATRCAFGVSSLASPKSWQKSGSRFFFSDFQCAGRASSMLWPSHIVHRLLAVNWWFVARKARSHIGNAWGTHGQRIGNLQFWPVRCRSLGVRHHSLPVRRVRWTNAMHSSSFAVCVEIFWACSKVCAEHDARDVHAKKDARHARSALDQRQTYVGHTPCRIIRCQLASFSNILTKVGLRTFSDFQSAGCASPCVPPVWPCL